MFVKTVFECTLNSNDSQNVCHNKMSPEKVGRSSVGSLWFNLCEGLLSTTGCLVLSNELGMNG